VNHKTVFGPISILTLTLITSIASAAPLDKSANAKIDEAINVHYLSTNFEKAEGLLKGTLKACGDRCSPAVMARAWMYIGIVRGAGTQNFDGASAAFAEALALDPNVKLDVDLATDEVRDLFEEASGGAASGEMPSDEPVDIAGPPSGAGMVCTPDVVEVETRRPIPMSCTTDQPAARVTVYYKEFGASRWGQANMGKSGDGWLAQVPCSATGIQGTFSWYAVAVSGQGRPIDSYGSEDAPQQIELVETSAEAPPSHPGKEPPDRCVDLAECPEDMRGTPACPDTGGSSASGGGGWGDSCEDNSTCQSDLACIDGTCQSPPSCETDADCTGGTCVDFLCQYEGASSSSPSGPGPTNLVGLQIGFDLAQISATGGVCNPDTGSKYSCYLDDKPYGVASFVYGGVDPVTMQQTQTTTPSTVHNPLDAAGNPNPNYDPLQSGQIPSTISPSTIRILATFERMLSENFGAEGRLGIALRGKPDSGFVDLLHLEARAKYWFSGNGPGLRLFGLLGAGIGQVDAQKKIYVNELQPDNSPTYNEKCPGALYCPVEVTAYKSLGKAFITGGLGVFYNLGGHGPSVELNARIMLPESGFVIQPTGGYLVGF